MSDGVTEFVSSITLPSDDYLALQFRMAQAAPDLAPIDNFGKGSTRCAQVNAGSLISFTDRLSRQNQQDVRNSTLLAQLAADKACPRYAKPMDWYKFYIDVLARV